MCYGHGVETIIFLPGLSGQMAAWHVLGALLSQARQVMLGRGVKGPNLEEKLITD